MKKVCPIALAFLVSAGGASHAAGWPEIGLSAHYAHWHGEYESHGAGGRFRWEPLAWLGVEGTVEAMMTEQDGKQRVDVPLGSQVYVPWEIVPRVRVRGLVGLCAMLTFADAGDDIQLGVRVGGGFEVALTGGWSLFSDVAWQRYLGHEREGGAWNEGLGAALEPTDGLAFALGLGVGI